MELRSSEKENNNIYTVPIDNLQKTNGDFATETDFMKDDENNESDYIDYEADSSLSNDNDPSSYFSSNRNETMNSIKDIKKSYALFILQLREEFLLPKNVTNVISTYITSLINNIQILLEKKVFDFAEDSNLFPPSSISRNELRKFIDFNQLKLLFDDVCNGIDSITKNEYQFTKYCEEYFNFTSVQEIPILSAGGDSDSGYFIPIENSLSLILSSQQLCHEILGNIHKQQTLTNLDNDLMFSIRESHHGLALDNDYLLIQLYLDDIGLTNPLGSKRDRHKMSMIYFTLEDIPDKYRSKLDFIQLVAICESKILKNLFGLFEDTLIQSRTIFDHDSIVQQILNDPNESPIMGVVGESPLHNLIGFHSSTSLPAGCVHDFLEGLCPMVIMLLLKEASSIRLMTHGENQFFNWNYHHSK
ncbi:unnamed protein product [Adineta steineri]|uniref:Uncharacterized protein n=1 Tax=Adineta steineri TaxID=433720 RepID=A0A815LGX6_9BILA|nr:unnamed protein product [Adineta steineri]CAF1616193.1 unnamed protein product [Adineta steineri]